MDALRGVAILLVVYGHAVQLSAMYTGHEFTRMALFIGSIGPLRMPLLFFLSGMLVPRALQKEGRRYFAGKASKLLWPYLLWSALTLCVALYLAHALTWWVAPAAWDFALAPIEHLWFLAYLLVYYVVAYLGRAVDPAWLVLGATMLMAIPVAGEWGRIAEMAVPFFLGATVARHQHILDRVAADVRISIALFVVTLGVSAGVQLGYLAAPMSWSLPILLAFFVGAIGIARAVSGSSLVLPLRLVGMKSIVIYLVHWPIMMAVVPLLATQGFRDPWPLFWVALSCGLLPGVLFAVASMKWPALMWLFEWKPERRGSSLAPARSPMPSSLSSQT